MKRLFAIVIGLLMILSLCSCSKPSTTYTIDMDGKTFEVDSEKGTIFDGTHTYRYTFSGDSSSYSIEISYPNGSTYDFDYSNHLGLGGWSDNYDEDLYVGGDTLCDVIVTEAPEPANPGRFFGAILLIGLGVLDILAPGVAWYLEYGWRFENAEPSELALEVNRIGGIVAIVVGIFLLFL